MSLAGQTAILRSRAELYRAELRRVMDVLRAVTKPDSEADSVIWDRFARLAASAADGLDAALASAPVTASQWQELDRARETVENLGRAVLAHVHSRLLSERGIDEGAGPAAERLIASLTNRAGIDRPALLGTGDADCMDHLASVVHYRPLGTTVWQLPVLAHEVGHHVAARLEDREASGVRPVKTWLAMESHAEAVRSGADFRQAGAWLHELFADVFATYALGSAYPLSVMMARVRYDCLAGGTSTHPPWARRIAVMIAALDAMSGLKVGQAAADTYRMTSQWLAERWAGITAAAPGQGTAYDDAQPQATAMIGLLATHALPRLRYDVNGPIDALREALDAGESTPCPNASPAQILNAAWSWRLRHDDADDTDVNSRALELCARAAL